MVTFHPTLRVVRQRDEMGPLAGTSGDLWVSCAWGDRGSTIHHMTKRIAAAFLWFYAGWYAGALIAEFVGVSALLGPIIGAAAAGLIVGDPRRMIWYCPGRAPGVHDRSRSRGSRRPGLTTTTEPTHRWGEPPGLPRPGGSASVSLRRLARPAARS